MIFLQPLATMTLGGCTVYLLLSAEGLPPDEADALWREALDEVYFSFTLPRLIDE